MNSVVYNELDRSWRSTTKILFGEEIGELDDYADWIKEYAPTSRERKSHLSGQSVILATDEYHADAKFISSDEAKKNITLDINEIKDIDSILNAISEKWEYCGNRTQGTSACIDSSDLIVDSQYVSGSMNIDRSSHIFSSFMLRDGCRHVFGGAFTANSEFLVKVIAAGMAKRCIESHFIGYSSDLYFCFGCYGCNDMMFSFNQYNKRNCIGNLQLPKDKYYTIKAKLLAEVKDELKRTKTFPSVFSLAAEGDANTLLQIPAVEREKIDITPIERSFSSTLKIVCGRGDGAMAPYEPWLSKHTLNLRTVTSPFGSKVFLPDGLGLSAYAALLPEGLTVSQGEAAHLGSLQLAEREINDLKSIRQGLARIAFFAADASSGTNRNAIESPTVDNVSNVYKAYAATASEYIGMSSLALKSNHVFGCHRIIDSGFCINCYNSLGLNRCFEMDTCTRCSDSYFCHNCEGIQNAMFCFNIKAKRYAIGNLELLQDKYRNIRESIIEQLSSELVKKKDLGIDIYNISCYSHSE